MATSQRRGPALVLECLTHKAETSLISHLLTKDFSLDGGNRASVIGFWSRQSWGLNNTICKDKSEPQALPRLKRDYQSTICPFTVISLTQVQKEHQQTWDKRS